MLPRRHVSLTCLAWASLAFLLSCTWASAAQPPASGAASQAPDFRALDAEALVYFRAYVRFDTTNPPSNTSDAIAFLKQILDNEGIATQTFESKPGMVTLVARLPGSVPSLKPLMLMSHADVVPAVAANWSHPPFSGDLADGYVWGRGAIDNKAHGIMALMTMLALKRLGIPLRRGVVMMVNPDEEAGGENGAGWMVANHWAGIESAFAMNEGGLASPDTFGGSGNRFSVAVAEKRVMWLKLTGHGKSGHGSMPNAENPNLILLKALNRLLVEEPSIRLTPILAEAMAALAPREPLPTSFELAHLEWPFMLDIAARGPLSPYYMQALLRDTIAPTVLNAGLKVNVIPSTSEADLDCRLLPGTDADEFLKRMRDLLAEPRISIDYIQHPDDAPPSPTNGEAWNAINEVVATDFENTYPVPWMTAGGTDSRFLRIKGVPAYGFVPIVLDRDELSRIHGVDERLSVENLNRGIRATYDVTMKLCGPRP